MIIAPLIYNNSYYCIYRENGQEVTFTIKDNQILESSDNLSLVEIDNIRKTLIDNENRIKVKQ